jgi:(4S)-4-hydroxy-5-phosphonooxypentane-2,3-dione isomerase
MLVVHVDIAVHADRVADFLAASVDNATASLTEPGVLRFDVLRDDGDPAHLVFVEVYRDEQAVSAHKQTPHYAAWRDAVAEMMAKPRTRVTYIPVTPTEDADWSSRR